MTRSLFVCTDLDRTLLPNGDAPESPDARPRFRALARREEVKLAYVSGRDKGLILDAMRDYDLPQPDWVVGDVGTSLYALDEDGEWRLDGDWSAAMDGAWVGAATVAALFDDLPDVTLQEPDKQGHHKVSYYAPHDVNSTALMAEMSGRLAAIGAQANLIWSVDETTNTGLLDILPIEASKKHAIEHLMAKLGAAFDTVFAGDSGNDLPVLGSAIPSVLVANATAQVRREAVALAARNGVSERLYLAEGGFMGMNGAYAAGILEGVAHFRPDATPWMGRSTSR